MPQAHIKCDGVSGKFRVPRSVLSAAQYCCKRGPLGKRERYNERSGDVSQGPQRRRLLLQTQRNELPDDYRRRARAHTRTHGVAPTGERRGSLHGPIQTLVTPEESTILEHGLTALVVVGRPRERLVCSQESFRLSSIESSCFQSSEVDV